MDKDKEYMRFLASCFALAHCGNPSNAIKMADELIESLKSVKTAGGIVDIVPKRKRTKN